MELHSLKRRNALAKPLFVLLFTVLGFLVMGYHPGIEDDGVYLAAVKADIQPTLYPHDSDFFRLQLQASLFDRWMANFVRVSRMPLPWAEMLWQFLMLFSILWATHSIAQQLFPQARAQWAGVAMVAAMFTLPVAGTALYLFDQHLHPRTVATALILVAISRILARKQWQAIPLLLLALVMHPIMAAMGVSFCFFLTLTLMEPVHVWLRSRSNSIAAAAVPLGWIFEPPSPTWREALQTRTYYFIYKWTWYEWLGALAPLLLFWLLHRLAKRQGDTLLARFAMGVLIFGVFQQAVAIVMLTPASFVRLTPLQPMRYLHLVYLFLTLMAGCLLGKYLLKARIWRWAIFLVVIDAGMFAPQRVLFAGSPHLEVPGRLTDNQWLQAFAWIRQNTPVDAYFGLDPNYLADPGEDYHSFRALAERSQLADAIKDTAVVTQVPQLGPEWARELQAEAGWDGFKLADFERLKSEFGTGWVLIRNPQAAGLECHWHNDLLSVCEIP
jgi:hypothetical protein